MISIPLNDKKNEKLFIMIRSNEILSGSGQKDEIQKTDSCSCGNRYQNHQKRDLYSKTVFQCPAKCEVNKTYNITGNCPVCNIPMEQVAEVHQPYY